jgi:hypothetical protein
MKKLLLTLNLLLITTIVTSQCVLGDCKNGFGKMQYQDAVYEGAFKNGNLEGLGIMQYTNGNYYFGQFTNSKFSGFGYFQWKDGQNHFGKWENSLQNGEGIFNNGKENITAGTWEKGIFKSAENTEVQPNNPTNSAGNCINGYGRISYADGLAIQAVFSNGKATFGRIYKNNQFVYDGFIVDNLFNGYGQILYANGDHYFGYFKDGKKQGEGILSQKDKPRIYGNWNNDEFIDPNAFNNEAFCDELITYITTPKEDRVSQKVSKLSNQYIFILERKFLGHFEIEQAIDIHSIDSTFINFPIDKEDIPKISLQALQDGMKKCKKLTYINPNEFSFNKIKLSILESFDIYFSRNGYRLKIKYPFEDLDCDSGDCNNGFGKKVDKQGNIYEGNFINGKFAGKGKLIWANGDVYVGEFIEGNWTKGKLIWANGDSYEGAFLNLKRTGKGIYKWIDGGSYEGDFIDGIMTGYGKEYDENGELIYEGDFLNNEYDGAGTYYRNGAKYIGGFKNGVFHGQGKFYDEKGTLKYEGQFKNGKYLGL